MMSHISLISLLQLPFIEEFILHREIACESQAKKNCFYILLLGFLGTMISRLYLSLLFSSSPHFWYSYFYVWWLCMWRSVRGDTHHQATTHVSKYGISIIWYFCTLHTSYPYLGLISYSRAVERGLAVLVLPSYPATHTPYTKKRACWQLPLLRGKGILSYHTKTCQLCLRQPSVFPRFRVDLFFLKSLLVCWLHNCCPFRTPPYLVSRKL